PFALARGGNPGDLRRRHPRSLQRRARGAAEDRPEGLGVELMAGDEVAGILRRLVTPLLARAGHQVSGRVEDRRPAAARAGIEREKVRLHTRVPSTEDFGIADVTRPPAREILLDRVHQPPALADNGL